MPCRAAPRLVVVLVLLASVAAAAVNAGRASATDAEKVRLEARALLDAWRDAQNRHAFDAYIALYDPTHFKGVKRTRDGGLKRFDLAGWSDDRRRMFQAKPEVATEDVRVVTWLDDEAKLKAGVTQVRFVQRWRSPRYADHGVKLLQLWRDRTGRQWIIYEDLLNSEAGWGTPTKAGATAPMAAPTGEAKALEAWRGMAPTGADHEAKLAAVPDTPEVRRPLARAVLATGDLACKKVVRTSQCGEETVEWEALDPAAGFDDPCLRRRLAVWAVEEGTLTDEDVADLADRLTTLVALPAPEEALTEAILARAARLDAAREGLRLRLLRAAAEAHVDLVAGALDGLSPGGLAILALEEHLDAAATALDLATQRAAVLAALGDGRLDPATRETLLDRVRTGAGADVSRALAGVADDAQHCPLAAAAAEALAERGDKSRLPRRPKGDDDAAFGRALCLLVHADGEARLTRWREFLPPSGDVEVTEQLDNDFAERDEEGNRIDSSPEPRSFTRADTVADDLPDAWGAGAPPTCSAGSCRVEVDDGYFEVAFAAGADGQRYVTRIHRYRWIGCPC